MGAFILALVGAAGHADERERTWQEFVHEGLPAPFLFRHGDVGDARRVRDRSEAVAFGAGLGDEPVPFGKVRGETFRDAAESGEGVHLGVDPTAITLDLGGGELSACHDEAEGSEAVLAVPGDRGAEGVVVGAGLDCGGAGAGRAFRGGCHIPTVNLVTTRVKGNRG